MKRRIFLCILALWMAVLPVRAEPIRWVDFEIPYASLRYALDRDLETSGEEVHTGWIEILALAACRTGGSCGLEPVRQAAEELKTGKSPEEVRHYAYYHEAYQAVLGGLVGNYAIEVNGEWKPAYGLKAFSPIAEGWSYSHCDDFGADRSFGFRRKHLGHDMFGTLGTPIAAVEGGVVEALGWNRYGGWRVGIRSFDSRRYYYYAHLRKDAPFAPGLTIGDTVEPGQLIGFMGKTGYSDTENTNNIETVHLHFGLQLIFDESQKECNSEIWVDVYDLIKLLDSHRSSLVRTEEGWKRKYPFRDLDTEPYPKETLR